MPGAPLHFRLAADVHQRIEGELQPFFEIHDARYMMYWLAMTPDSYASYLEETAREEAALAALDARTRDKVQPGEQQPETDHRMETDGSVTGNDNDVFYRDARNGRSFSYLMRTGGRGGVSLFLKYWGVGEWKTREFDIFVDGTLLKSVNNTGRWNTSSFITEEFPVPDDESITTCYICTETGMPEKTFSPEAVALLQEKKWPGNIRELKNVVERLLILGDDVISAQNVRDYVL